MEWRMVRDYEGLYWINPDGQVKNARGVILKPHKVGNTDTVILFGQGIRQEYSIDLLLALSYPEKYTKEEKYGQ